MFSRPFASFDPAPEEQAAGAAVRKRIVAAVKVAIKAGQLQGDAIDIAHAYVALIHGLAAAESFPASRQFERHGPAPLEHERRRAAGGLRAPLILCRGPAAGT